MDLISVDRGALGKGTMQNILIYLMRLDAPTLKNAFSQNNYYTLFSSILPFNILQLTTVVGVALYEV